MLQGWLSGSAQRPGCAPRAPSPNHPKPQPGATTAQPPLPDSVSPGAERGESPGVPSCSALPEPGCSAATEAQVINRGSAALLILFSIICY